MRERKLYWLFFTRRLPRKTAAITMRGEKKKGKHRKLRDRKIDLLLALQAQTDLPLTFPETHKHKSLGLIHKHVAANNTVTLEYNTQENVHF